MASFKQQLVGVTREHRRCNQFNFLTSSTLTKFPALWPPSPHWIKALGTRRNTSPCENWKALAHDWAQARGRVNRTRKLQLSAHMTVSSCAEWAGDRGAVCRLVIGKVKREGIEIWLTSQLNNGKSREIPNESWVVATLFPACWSYFRVQDLVDSPSDESPEWKPHLPRYPLAIALFPLPTFPQIQKTYSAS